MIEKVSFGGTLVMSFVCQEAREQKKYANRVLPYNTFANFVKRPQAKAWTAVATTGGTPATHCLGYTSEARLRGLKSLQAAQAAFVRIAAPF